VRHVEADAQAEGSDEAAAEPHRDPRKSSAMAHHDYRVRVYLLAVSALCREVAAKPASVQKFVDIIELVPETLRELKPDARRLAA
jgi:hypothetical protein